MLRFLIITAAVIAVLFSATHFYRQSNAGLAANIDTATHLEWDDLVPSQEPVAETPVDIPINIRYDLGFIGKVQSDANAHLISRESPEYRNAMTLLEKHRADGVDVDRLMPIVTGRDQAIGARGEAINSSLDGKFVSLPGYALPLEMQEGGVTEFLLVPIIGACIHVPPPPPNQIVLARLESAYEVKELYDPVLITGHLTAQSTSSELYLVDGQAQVPMGYSMQVVHVEAIE